MIFKNSKNIFLCSSLIISSHLLAGGAGDAGNGGDFIKCSPTIAFSPGERPDVSGHLFLDFAVYGSSDWPNWTKVHNSKMDDVFIRDVADMFADSNGIGGILAQSNDYAGPSGEWIKNQLYDYALVISNEDHYLQFIPDGNTSRLLDENLSENEKRILENNGCPSIEFDLGGIGLPDADNRYQAAIELNGTYMFNMKNRDSVSDGKENPYLPSQRKIMHLHEALRKVLTDSAEIRKWVRFIFDSRLYSASGVIPGNALTVFNNPESGVDYTELDQPPLSFEYKDNNQRSSAINCEEEAEDLEGALYAALGSFKIKDGTTCENEIKEFQEERDQE